MRVDAMVKAINVCLKNVSSSQSGFLGEFMPRALRIPTIDCAPFALKLWGRRRQRCSSYARLYCPPVFNDLLAQEKIMYWIANP
jgi:hypothetical protein